MARQAYISLSECPLKGQLTLVPSADPGAEDGGVLTADVPNSFELRQWLRSLGPNAEVLEPGFLRNEIAQDILVQAQRYGVVLPTAK